MTDDAPECCRRSFASSLADTARRLLEDPTVAPGTVAEERLSICSTCEHLSASKTCDLCGCLMSLKVKMSNMKCPIDKWTEYKSGN